MSHFKTLLVLVTILGTTLGQVCPPAAEFSPCTCDEVKLILSCKNIQGRFDIKAVFDRITPLVDTSTIYNELEIRETSLFEIPADAIPALKFKVITIDMNGGLDLIYSNAFNATYEVTTELSLWNNAFVNEAPFERELFDFFNKFTQVTKIWLPSHRLTSIPDNAFTENPNLVQLYFGSGGPIRSIGAMAFSKLSNLERVYMSFSSITTESLTPDTFKDMSSTKLDMDLTHNTGLDYLDEAVFKPLLETAALVQVGGGSCGHTGCSYQYLTCDERADWLCPLVDLYQEKLTGFRCAGQGSSTFMVWDYCALQANISQRIGA